MRLRGATHLDRPWEMPTCFVALGASFTTQMAHKNIQAPHFTLMFTPGKAPNSSCSMAHSKVGMASPFVLRHMRFSRTSAKSGLTKPENSSGLAGATVTGRAIFADIGYKCHPLSEHHSPCVRLRSRPARGAVGPGVDVSGAVSPAPRVRGRQTPPARIARGLWCGHFDRHESHF